MTTSPPKNRKFEEALDELETIIERLESGQIGLEDCLVEYERGRKLIAECDSILSRVRDRIAELSIASDGSIKSKEGQAMPKPDNASEEIAPF